MWVFGYGSLMWDGWETSKGCLRCVPSELPGYRRTFNKASTKNWGSKSVPCPTLNLERKDGAICRGMAFEFPDGQKSTVLDYLGCREGKGFVFRELLVRVGDASEVTAHVSLYEGKNLVTASSPLEIASMIRAAKGTKGSCRKYVQGIAEKLVELGVEDPTVSEIWEAVKGQDSTAA